MLEEAQSRGVRAPGWLGLIATFLSGCLVASAGGLLAQRDASVRVAATVELHTAQITAIQAAIAERAKQDATTGERMARIEATLDEVRELLRRGR